MQITGVEVEPEPHGFLFVDQFEYVMQSLPFANRMMIANFADDVFTVTPADGMWYRFAMFGTVIHNHAHLFVYFFAHSSATSDGVNLIAKLFIPSDASIFSTEALPSWYPQTLKALQIA